MAMATLHPDWGQSLNMRGNTGKPNLHNVVQLICLIQYIIFLGLGQIPVWSTETFEVTQTYTFHIKPASHV